MKNLKYFLSLFIVLLFVISCTDDEEGYTDNGLYIYDDTNEQVSGEQYEDYGENPFVNVADEAISTFSVDADGGSYSNMRRYITSGYTPPTASVRIEEFINYFTFNYSEPTDGENVALNSEISTCPWAEQHYILRLGMKGKTIALEQLPNSNYVFLIDVSGSMNDDNKLGILKRGFKTMVDNLRNQDRVAIVTYAGEDGVLLNSTGGDEKEKIKTAIDMLGAGGSTAGAAGISTAYEIAEEYFIPGGNNRIILGTDGDFNVGPSTTDELVEMIEQKRESGIYLTVLGVGSGNLNDAMLEQLANNGNGNYEYIDNEKQVEKVFVYETQKFYTIAKDCKIQITFNPEYVESYRLIGYENRVLNNEDFTDDSKDAGEIGVSQTITALYELVLKSSSSGNLYATFDFRYKKPEEESSRLISHEVLNAPVDMELASENMKFAISVAGFGLLLKESQYKGNLTKNMVRDLAKDAMTFDPHYYRQEFLGLVGSVD